MPESLFASASPILASLWTSAVLFMPRLLRYPYTTITTRPQQLGNVSCLYNKHKLLYIVQ